MTNSSIGIRRRVTLIKTTRSNNKHQPINEVDDNAPIDEIENWEGDVFDQDYPDMDEINFPMSDLTEEEDQAYYYDD